MLQRAPFRIKRMALIYQSSVEMCADLSAGVMVKKQKTKCDFGLSQCRKQQVSTNAIVLSMIRPYVKYIVLRKPNTGRET